VICWLRSRAGPGFINLRLNAAAKQAVAHAVLREASRFGRGAEAKAVAGRRVRLRQRRTAARGHARQAALGDRG